MSVPLSAAFEGLHTFDVALTQHNGMLAERLASWLVGVAGNASDLEARLAEDDARYGEALPMGSACCLRCHGNQDARTHLLPSDAEDDD